MLPNSDYLVWGTSIWFFCGTERIHESSPIIKKEGGYIRSRRIWVAKPCNITPSPDFRRQFDAIATTFRPFAASWVDRVCSISAVAPAKLCFTSPIAFLVESVWISVQV